MNLSSLLMTLAAGLAPVPVIYLFYRRYFRLEKQMASHLEYFSYGVVLAGLLFIAGMFLKPLMPSRNPFFVGFVHAALLEKTGAFLLIALLMLREKKGFTVINAVISAMMLGLGFAALENILYGMTRHSSVIMVRYISSVPLHVLTCGFIGYFLALFRLADSPVHKTFSLILAFTGPLLFHGFYDSLLFSGRTMTYFVPVVLVLLIMIMEYILARSQVLPYLDELKEKKISIEDWRAIEMEPQFERWILRSMGSKIKERVPFFGLHISRIKWAVIIVLTVIAVISFVLKGSPAAIPARLSTVETVMLFILLPALYAFNLFVVGLVNPEYFRSSVIRIPIIIDAVFTLEVDAEKEDDVIDTVTYHVSSSSSFFKTPVPLQPGMKVSCILYCSRFSSPIFEGRVALDRHNEDEQFNGTLVKFTSRPPGFWLFLVRYYLYRLSKGISYNLNLPGSKEIRQLFVRPVSVMQQEYTYPEGHQVFKQGDQGNDFYLIRKGKINIMKKLSNGEEILLSTLGRGSLFGEMAILGDQTRMATAVCSSECVLAVASADNLEALIESNPEFTMKLIETLARRHHASEQTFQRNIKEMNRSMSRKNRLLFSLVKMLLACVSDAGITEGAGMFDHSVLSSLMDLEKEQVIDLLKELQSCSDGDDLAERIDNDTAAEIVKVFSRYSPGNE